MKIYKFQLKVQGSQVIQGYGLKPLSVDIQKGVPCLWAIVDNSQTQKTQKEILIYGTGHQIFPSHENAEFLGTFLLDDGEFVGHVFVL